MAETGNRASRQRVRTHGSSVHITIYGSIFYIGRTSRAMSLTLEKVNVHFFMAVKEDSEQGSAGGITESLDCHIIT